MSLPAWTVSSQGVRQLCPCEVRASAPGGSDSTRKTSLGGVDLKISMLGMDIEHAASAKLQAITATTRVMIPPNWTAIKPPEIPAPTIRPVTTRRNQSTFTQPDDNAAQPS